MTGYNLVETLTGTVLWLLLLQYSDSNPNKKLKSEREDNVAIDAVFASFQGTGRC